MFEALRSSSNIAMEERKTTTGMVTGWEDSWAHVPGKGVQAVEMQRALDTVNLRCLKWIPWLFTISTHLAFSL